jgi:predicted ATPase
MEWVLRQQSVVLILDDAHWIDPSSWNLALTLLKKFSDAYGLLVVILTRPMATTDQNVMKLLRLEDTVRLSLPPLTEKQSQELLARLLG